MRIRRIFWQFFLSTFYEKDCADITYYHIFVDCVFLNFEIDNLSFLFSSCILLLKFYLVSINLLFSCPQWTWEVNQIRKEYMIIKLNLQSGWRTDFKIFYLHLSLSLTQVTKMASKIADTIKAALDKYFFIVIKIKNF